MCSYLSNREWCGLRIKVLGIFLNEKSGQNLSFFGTSTQLGVTLKADSRSTPNSIFELKVQLLTPVSEVA